MSLGRYRRQGKSLYLFSKIFCSMLSIKRITKIVPVPPRTVSVSKLGKVNAKIKTIGELTQFFKSLLEKHDLNALLLERKSLLRIEELAILGLIGEKDDKNKKTIFSILEDTRKKINNLNLKIFALLHEIPISEIEVSNWKKEIISIIDYIYNAQRNKLQYPLHLEEFLNSRISKLANLKEAVSHHIDELEKKVEEFEEELNNIEVKCSLGLLDDSNHAFLKERIEEALKITINEINDLKCFDMQIGFLSHVRMIEKDLYEISRQIAQNEEKYRASEINTDEYNKLIIELKKKEGNLREKLITQKKIYEECQEKIKALKGRIILRDIDKLLV